MALIFNLYRNNPSDFINRLKTCKGFKSLDARVSMFGNIARFVTDRDIIEFVFDEESYNACVVTNLFPGKHTLHLYFYTYREVLNLMYDIVYNIINSDSSYNLHKVCKLSHTRTL